MKRYATSPTPLKEYAEEPDVFRTVEVVNHMESSSNEESGKGGNEEEEEQQVSTATGKQNGGESRGGSQLEVNQPKQNGQNGDEGRGGGRQIQKRQENVYPSTSAGCSRGRLPRRYANNPDSILNMEPDNDRCGEPSFNPCNGRFFQPQLSPEPRKMKEDWETPTGFRLFQFLLGLYFLVQGFILILAPQKASHYKFVARNLVQEDAAAWYYAAASFALVCFNLFGLCEKNRNLEKKKLLMMVIFLTLVSMADIGYSFTSIGIYNPALAQVIVVLMIRCGIIGLCMYFWLMMKFPDDPIKISPLEEQENNNQEYQA